MIKGSELAEGGFGLKQNYRYQFVNHHIRNS